ncbi:hypothetical protein, partial [Ruegeria sp. HKCCC1038]|uniref:hypothetical protein n=1 Tax=Ruegeria sp. HKCCC1038 TaxID=2682982 RepID=UPI001C2CACE4
MQTVIQPTARFNKLVGQLGILRTDILMTPWREPLVLKHRKDSQWDASRYVEYDETQETLCLRAGVDKINDWLRSAELSLEMQNDLQSVDLSDRCLRRIFTCNSFCSGGRLFGGFWQPMKKSDRFSSIKINGESIAEVDFGQIMPRLVYSIRGISPKMSDLYAIPGFENYRPGIKKFMSSMLFAEVPIRRMPRGLRELFPPSVSAAEVTKAIQSAHPDIGHMFGTGIGHRCQYLESEILVSVLNRLMMLGLTALP